MLPTTVTTGTAGNAKTFTKQYDTPSSTSYGVGGLPASESKTLLISEERSNSGKSIGIKEEISYVMPVPGSTTGETVVVRSMHVLKYPSWLTGAEVLAIREDMKDLQGNTTLQTGVFNGER